MPASLRRAMADVRILDPAYRDQDPEAWRTGRFEERVRREWNPVRTATLRAAPDLGTLADAIHKVVGGDRSHILDRLGLFADVDGPLASARSARIRDLSAAGAALDPPAALRRLDKAGKSDPIRP